MRDCILNLDLIFFDKLDSFSQNLIRLILFSPLTTRDESGALRVGE